MKFFLVTIFFFYVTIGYSQIGIGTTSPNSTLDVRGSFSLNYRAITTSSTALSTDNSLVFTGSAASTLTLPDATTCAGRMYSIKNASTTLPSPILTIATSSSQTIDGIAVWLLDEQNETITVASNGSNWNIGGGGPPKTRSNYVLVKAMTDFPAPVGGIITLAPATLYEINGIVTVTSKIDLNGCTIMGGDRFNDKLIYTPTSGELFTGAKGGSISNITLSATGIGSKLFNMDAAGAPNTFIIEFTFILNCDNIGLIKGFSGFVVFQSIGYSNNKNGIIFQDIGDFIGINGFWVADNQNTYETFVGAFGSIHFLAGKKQMLSYFSAKALDISGITSIAIAASLKNGLFVGDGTYVVGNFSNKWEVETYGLSTEKDDVAAGNLYISSPMTTAFSDVNTPTKVLGTTSSSDLFRVTSTSNNRLTYTGVKQKKFLVMCSLSLTATSSNKTFSFYIAKNGVIQQESKQTRRVPNADQSVLTLSCLIALNLNDHIEIWVENNTDNTSLTVQTLNLAIK